MSFSAHKTYGPKGIGALYVSRKPRVRLEATMHGGGHERGMRSGTLATHQIVGMGEAFRVAKEDMAAENVRIKALSDRFFKQVEHLEELYVNGSMTARVPHNLNLSFNYVEGESLIMALKDLAVSSGTACPGPQRRAGTQLDPLHLRSVHHRGRNRLRRAESLRGRDQVARPVAALGHVQGWRRYLEDRVGGTLNKEAATYRTCSDAVKISGVATGSVDRKSVGERP